MIRIGSEGPVVGKDYIYVLTRPGNRVCQFDSNYIAKYTGQGRDNLDVFKFLQRITNSINYERYEIVHYFVEALHLNTVKDLKLKVLLTQLLRCIGTEEIYELIYESGI